MEKISIIYDVQNDLKKKLIHVMNIYLSDYQEVQYQNIKQPVIIFKECYSEKDILSLKDYQIPEHTLIPIIQDMEMMFLLLEQYPLCFIRKEHLKDDLKKTMELIKKIYYKEEQVLTFKIGYSYIQTKSSNIIYIESLGHYLMIHTVSGTYKVREKLSTLTHKLPQYFQQVHKSYIINEKYVIKKTSHDILMKDQSIIPIGRKYKLETSN